MQTENNVRIPNEGEYVRGLGTLLKIVHDAPPPPKPLPAYYIFKEISARIELRFNGDVIKERGTLWDAYGYESSVKSAIKDAKEYAKSKHIGPASELEVVVVRIESQIRKEIEDGENFYEKGFKRFETTSYNSQFVEDIEADAWSSKTPEVPA